jgi:Fur family ferric uptake transcriptional regulator
MTGSSQLETALDRAGYRLTEPRRAVVELIGAREGHFTAADLVRDARVRRLGLGRATIFRSLDLLTGLSVLERLDLPSGEHAYVPCEPRHHHHVVCSACGRSTEVEDLGIGSIVHEVELRTGYRIDDHRLELYGRCPRCRST